MKLIRNILLAATLTAASLSASAGGKPPTQTELDKMQAALPTTATVKPKQPRKILIFDKCEGYVHGCIPLASKTFEMMGKKSGAYESVTSSDMSAFDAENLAKFDAVLLNNTTKLKFENPAYRKALLDFVKSGKGIIGIHAASDNFDTWPEAANMIGGAFDGHPWRANGTWAVKLDDPSHPIDKGFAGKNFMIHDEIYQIKGDYSRNTHRVLLSLDMSQAVNRNVKGIKRTDNDFAIAWIKPFGKGRVFYSSLGHNREIYWNQAVLQHYLDGIQYALGDLDADDTPSAVIAAKNAYTNLLKYEYGSDKTALGEITKSIKGASSAERAAIELKLITVLQNPQASTAAKQFVCRMLRRCGTEASVPALAALLPDKELSQMARFAMQGLNSPKVDTTLLQALNSVETELAIGIIGTLGQRRTAKAIPRLTIFTSSENKAESFAAITALGRIGTPAAAEVLTISANSLPKAAVTDALLTAAEHLSAENNPNIAASIYHKLYTDKQPDLIKIATLRGLVLTEKADSVPLLVEVLDSDNPELKKYAIGLISTLPAGVDVTKAIAAPLPKLLPEIQALLIAALTERGDASALEAITAAAKSDNPATKESALLALGAFNDSNSIPLLTAALSNNDKTAERAAESLSRMDNSEIGGLLIAELNTADNPNVRRLILETLAARSEKDALPIYINALKDADAKVSKAAAKALGTHGGTAEIRPILSILTTTEDSGQRRNAEKAISMIAIQTKAYDAIARPVAAALPDASPAVAPSLINILKRCGGAVALSALQQEAGTDDLLRRKNAVRALAAWQDAAPAETLLQIAQNDDDNSTRILALNGCIKLAGRMGGTKGMELTRKLLKIAERPEDKKIILNTLAQFPHSDTLPMIEPFLSMPELQTEAEKTYSAIASAIVKTEPLAAAAALQKVTTFKNSTLAENAKKEMSKIKAENAFITAWMLSGPYTKQGVSANKLLDTAFPPENSAADIKWVSAKNITNGAVQLDKQFGGYNRAAYMLTELISDKEQTIRLYMGSDDGIKVWLNGKVVYNNNAVRPYKPDSDKADITLKAGKNRLLVKISQGSGEWLGGVRVSAPDGTLAQGLIVSTGSL